MKKVRLKKRKRKYDQEKKARHQDHDQEKREVL